MTEGDTVGTEERRLRLGLLEGTDVGAAIDGAAEVGEAEEAVEGGTEGEGLGSLEGDTEGITLGAAEGSSLGTAEGESEGWTEG